MFPIKDKNKTERRPITLWVLIGVNLAVFAVQCFRTEAEIRDWFTRFGMIPAQLALDDPSTWSTLITSQFLHGGYGHIAANLWMLFVFGDNVEDRMGPLRFVIFYLLCGIAAGLTHCAFDMSSEIPTIGASGAIAGVLGAYIVFFPRARILSVIPILYLPLLYELPAGAFLGIWFGLQIVNGSVGFFTDAGTGAIAWWAHAGGFVAGFLLCRIFARKRAA